MDKQDIQRLLENVRAGKLSVARALEQLRHMPYEDLGFAKIDHHRGLRQGFAEVVYAKGKTPRQVVSIVRGMLRPRTSHNILITRADAEIFRAVRRVSRGAKFHPLSGAISIRRNREIVGEGAILVVAAGTSDIPVAEEAAVTAEIMGNTVESVYDVGVAGLHRLLAPPGKDRRGARHRVRRGNGRGAAERRRRAGGRAGDCRADQRGLRGQLRRVGRASGDAE